MDSHPLTANEMTLLAAAISAVTSLIVWFLAHKFGPNYRKQIADLTETLSKILQQHSSIAEALASISTQSESRWRPSARIESQPRENHLILKSDHEFKIERIALLAANGAVVAEIPQKDSEMLRSTGYRVTLPQDRITQFWNESSGPRNGWATGAIGVDVSREGNPVNVQVPFVARQDFDSQGSTIYAWIRLTG